MIITQKGYMSALNDIAKLENIFLMYEDFLQKYPFEYDDYRSCWTFSDYTEEKQDLLNAYNYLKEQLGEVENIALWTDGATIFIGYNELAQEIISKKQIDEPVKINIAFSEQIIIHVRNENEKQELKDYLKKERFYEEIYHEESKFIAIRPREQEYFYVYNIDHYDLKTFRFENIDTKNSFHISDELLRQEFDGFDSLLFSEKENLKYFIGDYDLFTNLYELYNGEQHFSQEELKALYYSNCADDYLSKCYCCGDICFSDELHEVARGDLVCDYCFDNEYSCCDHCGEYFHNYDDSFNRVITRGGYEEYWCDNCCENNAFWCDGNEQYYDDYYHNSCEVNGRTYSEYYCNAHFYWCDNCESYVDYSDWNHEQECCCDCAEDDEDILNDYTEDTSDIPPQNISGDIEDNEDYSCFYLHGHMDNPQVCFCGKVPKQKLKNNVFNRYHWGFELETDRKNGKEPYSTLKKLAHFYNTKINEIYFKHDGSLRYGFEMVSQPHTYKALCNMKIAEMLKVLIDDGYLSHNTSTAGLHFHVSRDFFGSTVEKQNIAIRKIMIFIEIYFNEIYKLSRRHSHSELEEWASPYSSIYYDTEKIANTCKKIVKNNRFDRCERYHAVNITNINTIEFRFFKGTLKYSSFMACLNFLYRICMNSKHIRFDQVKDVKLWLKGIDENTKEYLRNRNAFVDYLD